MDQTFLPHAIAYIACLAEFADRCKSGNDNYTSPPLPQVRGEQRRGEGALQRCTDHYQPQPRGRALKHIGTLSIPPFRLRAPSLFLPSQHLTAPTVSSSSHYLPHKEIFSVWQEQRMRPDDPRGLPVVCELWSACFAAQPPPDL